MVIEDTASAGSESRIDHLLPGCLFSCRCGVDSSDSLCHLSVWRRNFVGNARGIYGVQSFAALYRPVSPSAAKELILIAA